jgi:hypothetical protein
MIKIVKAAERLAKKVKINILLLGGAGSGKTTEARTLPPETTLFLDGEAGTLALGDWQGDSIDIREMAKAAGCHPWEYVQALATIIGGPDPMDTNGPYGLAAHEAYKAVIGDPAMFEKYDILFIDSITVLSRWCFSWAQMQPDAFSEKLRNPDGTPKANTLGAYGLLGREMVKFITHMQHCPKSCIFACILEKKLDDLERASWEPQIMGGMTGRELPGIIDEVITLSTFSDPSVGTYRAFITQFINPYGFPAKDRSGCLELMEQPDLGKLIEKIRAGKRLDGQLTTGLPNADKTLEKQPDTTTAEPEAKTS